MKTVTSGRSFNASRPSNFDLNSMLDPDASTVLIAANRPCTWNRGRTWSSTTLPVNRQDRARTDAFEARLARVNIAPFDRPVVPEVYTIAARELGESGGSN